jgi:hypothetical protein
LADILPSEAEARAAVYGDAAYGAGELWTRVDNANIHNGLKVQPPSTVKGSFSKEWLGAFHQRRQLRSIGQYGKGTIPMVG